MADTLTQLTAKAQAQLLDNGTLFTAATLTAAARQALQDLNKRAAMHASTTITAVASQKEYELSDVDAAAINVIDVLTDDSADTGHPLAFYSFHQDERVFFRLRDPQPAGLDLLVHYTKPHTVSGLDSATDSTLSDSLNVALINGICAYACLIRVAATIESNNVQPQVARTWLDNYRTWLALFNSNLKAAAAAPTPHGDPPRPTAWNDPQHSELYP